MLSCTSWGDLIKRKRSRGKAPRAFIQGIHIYTILVQIRGLSIGVLHSCRDRHEFPMNRSTGGQGGGLGGWSSVFVNLGHMR